MDHLEWGLPCLPEPLNCQVPVGSETSQASCCWGQSPARHSVPFPGSSCWSPERGDLNPSRRQSAQPGRTNCKGVTARPRHQVSGTQTTRSRESPFAQAVGTGRPGRQGLGPHRASCPGRREHRDAPGQGPTSRSHRDSSGTSHRRVAAAQGLPGRGYPLLGDISSRVAGKVISLHWGWLHSRDYIL